MHFPVISNTLRNAYIMADNKTQINKTGYKYLKILAKTS